MIQITSQMTRQEKRNLILAEIIKYIDFTNSKKITNFVSRSYIYINQEKYSIKNLVIRMTSFLDSKSNVKVSERFYCLYYGINKIPKCQHCKKNYVTFQDFTKGYDTYCSIKCASCSDETKEKRQNTSYKKYGTKIPSQSEITKQRTRESNLNKYGVSSPMQTDDIKKRQQAVIKQNYGVNVPLKNPNIHRKLQKTNFQKYGTKHFTQSEFYLNKKKQSCLEKYGVNHPIQSMKIKERVRSTNLERYGVNYPQQNQEIREKTTLNNLEKYGVENPAQLPEIKKKLSQSNLLTKFNDVMNNKRFSEVIPLFNFNSYIGTRQKHDYNFQCQYCGKIFTHRIENGQTPLCPKCYPKSTSKLEHQIREFIESYVENPIYNTRRIIPPQELDIYLPEYNLAIEFNGLYWHSEEQGKDQNYHRKKSGRCYQKGIKLIHIFEDEWIHKSDRVKSLILENLNKLPYKININNCQLSKINLETAEEFLNQHHIFSYNKDVDYAFGLFYQTYLVSVLTLSDNDLGNFEIARFTNYNMVEIKDSFNTLVNYAIKQLNISKLEICVDLRFDHGKYLDEFKLVKEIDPNFFYVTKNPQERNGTLTNYQSVIWDVGQALFEKEIEKFFY